MPAKRLDAPDPSQTPEMNALKTEHKVFVKEYVANLGNGRRAYRKAYPKSKESSADCLSSRLLDNIKVQAAIQAEHKKLWKEKDTEVARNKVYQKIMAIGDSKVTDVMVIEDGNAEIRTLEDISEMALHAIQSIERTRKDTKFGVEERIVVKMHNKLAALEMQGKILGIIDNKEDQSPLEVIIIPAVRPDRRPAATEGEK